MTTPTAKEEKKIPDFYDLYIIDGKSYDLMDWIPKHPGGSIWFARSNGRDISAAVHTYHKHPKVLFEILKKY